MMKKMAKEAPPNTMTKTKILKFLGIKPGYELYMMCIKRQIVYS